MTEREKLFEIIDGAMGEIYFRKDKINRITDALIAAGIGDVSWRRKNDICRFYSNDNAFFACNSRLQYARLSSVNESAKLVDNTKWI